MLRSSNALGHRLQRTMWVGHDAEVRKAGLEGEETSKGECRGSGTWNHSIFAVSFFSMFTQSDSLTLHLIQTYPNKVPPNSSPTISFLLPAFPTHSLSPALPCSPKLTPLFFHLFPFSPLSGPCPSSFSPSSFFVVSFLSAAIHSTHSTSLFFSPYPGLKKHSQTFPDRMD